LTGQWQVVTTGDKIVEDAQLFCVLCISHKNGRSLVMGAWASQRNLLMLTYKWQIISYKIMYSTLFLASEFILNYKRVLFTPLRVNLEYK